MDARLSHESAVTLNYSITDYTSSSNERYAPQNVMKDDPRDVNSRWSSTPKGGTKQWILLRLENLSVLKSITFGKFNQPHQCNLKEFKIYIGLSPVNMMEVLHAGLKNDSEPEEFAIRYTNAAGVPFPIEYVKVVPLAAHSPNSNTSIWYIKLSGIVDSILVNEVSESYDGHRETLVLRHVLKHLRSRRLLTAYEEIRSRTGLMTEHPIVSELYRRVVLEGDWDVAENLLSKMAATNLFDEYLFGLSPHAKWTRIRSTDADGNIPTPRAGHAACFDPENKKMYIHGGFDGINTLEDFWVFDAQAGTWTLIEPLQPHPGARSCHRMVFDELTGCIYLLGAFSEPCPPHQPRTRHACSDMYRYHTRGMQEGKWDIVCPDTALANGPPLVFDHAMAIDSAEQTIFVFGGCLVDDADRYAGLYSYDIRTSRWTVLQAFEGRSANVLMPPRSGHAMVYDPSIKTLFIFGGLKAAQHLSDMYAYEVTTRTVVQLCKQCETTGGPQPCFNLRAAIDTSLKEIYIFGGSSCKKNRPGPLIMLERDSYYIYRYSTSPGRWCRILSDTEQPDPRLAHQVVYDSTTRTFFLHGGNAGNGDDQIVPSDKRLDDLWSMTPIRYVAASEIVRKCKFILRQQHFREICEALNRPDSGSASGMTPVQALKYLQNEISSVVDHSDLQEAETFRSLLGFLLSPVVPKSPPAVPEPAPRPQKRLWTSMSADEDIAGDMPTETALETPHPQRASITVRDLLEVPDPLETRRSDAGSCMSADRFKQRTALFERLLEFVNEDAKEPLDSLVNIIDFQGGAQDTS
ncbi:hypothetical protein FISHEDRAFT_45639 [Fistulina hepatica ATCC 64428]|uniref:Muskelin N-terminal domain-containing protein n=1 Tax=Fistulina hepatica ATCC 64428 TaxID=1128425 RepID=A0A0D7ABE1_9AGAR|nr:hypothetical protein FISHEDRAFT_45639 [Fistulina hepatica ATCC 64428]